MFSANVRVVKKSDVNFHSVEEDKVKNLLDKWAEYMYTWEGIARGVNLCECFIKSWVKDFEEQVHAADRKEVEAVKGAIDSLLPRYRDAINEYYSLGSRVLKFAKPATFEDAKEQIRPLLAKRGLL